jgi:hypothetical protein
MDVRESTIKELASNRSTFEQVKTEPQEFAMFTLQKEEETEAIVLGFCALKDGPSENTIGCLSACSMG